MRKHALFLGADQTMDLRHLISVLVFFIQRGRLNLSAVQLIYSFIYLFVGESRIFHEAAQWSTLPGNKS